MIKLKQELTQPSGGNFDQTKSSLKHSKQQTTVGNTSRMADGRTTDSPELNGRSSIAT